MPAVSPRRGRIRCAMRVVDGLRCSYFDRNCDRYRCATDGAEGYQRETQSIARLTPHLPNYTVLMSDALNEAANAGTTADCDSPAPGRRRRTSELVNRRSQSAATGPTACSDVPGEPLAGSAKTATLFLALENTDSWSHDVLDGGVFGTELSGRIKKWLKGRDGALQLIRRPGREGRVMDGDPVLYIAHCTPDQPGGAWMEKRTVTDVEELLSLDIRLGLPTPGATRTTDPLLLVCTHGKRDVCCAVKGRPVAQALHNIHGDRVWETSHSKGHRFAPTMILLPWNYSYGRISVAETDRVIREAADCRLDPAGCRGRGVWEAKGQVAELAVREMAGVWGFDDVAAVREPDGEIVHVTLRNGRRFEVTLVTTVIEGVISSCGDSAGSKKAWIADAVHEIDRAPKGNSATAGAGPEC